MKKICNVCKNKSFLMDNVSFHKSKIIKNIANNSSNNLLFIPPYSPELNPIEEFFSLLKLGIKDNSNNRSNIRSNITLELNKLKNMNLQNYYKHSFQK